MLSTEVYDTKMFRQHNIILLVECEDRWQGYIHVRLSDHNVMLNLQESGALSRDRMSQLFL